MKYQIKTHKKEELIDITNLIIDFIKNEKINEGSILIHVPHTTAGLTINENSDPDVKDDIIKALMTFNRTDYMHSEGNSAAHIKSSLMGCTLTIMVQNNKPILGTWQGIMFCEFDGPRTRTLYINKP